MSWYYAGSVYGDSGWGLQAKSPRPKQSPLPIRGGDYVNPYASLNPGAITPHAPLCFAVTTYNSNNSNNNSSNHNSNNSSNDSNSNNNSYKTRNKIIGIIIVKIIIVIITAIKIIVRIIIVIIIVGLIVVIIIVIILVIIIICLEPYYTLTQGPCFGGRF